MVGLVSPERLERCRESNMIPLVTSPARYNQYAIAWVAFSIHL